MDRRSFLRGLIAAPVVIRTAGLLMPVRAQPIWTPKKCLGIIGAAENMGWPRLDWGAYLRAQDGGVWVPVESLGGGMARYRQVA
jgi:hypothetical protein